MTLAEFERRQWAWLQSQDERAKEIISIGWWSAALERQQRLTTLRTLLTPSRTPTEDELKELEEYHRKLVAEIG